MPIPTDYPLESFDPRFEQMLLRGARGEDFTVRCKTSSEAHRLQHMLHSFRARAQKKFGDSAPEKWKPLYTAVVGLMKDENGKRTLVHIYSRHNEFDHILDAVMGRNDTPIITPDNDPLAEFDPQPTAKSEGSGG
jgi:hypothetical protein